jgi:hydrogenase nickel incorporation protein HypA/HybF
MHELSIARALADSAERHAQGRRVVKLELRVGHLRQVVPDSLEFAFAAVTRGTALEGAALEITHVPVSGRCRECAAQSTMDELPLRCARCGALDVELLEGEELLLDALELEEPLAEAGAGAGSGAEAGAGAA